jgi:hypothetical protein
MQNTASRAKITVSADGTGLVSQAGMVLLAEAARVTGLGQGLSAGLARWRAPRAVHDPGKIIADLATTVALGGDCLADVAVLRAQPQLAGSVASDPVISRLTATLAADAPRALRAIRKARAAARERAWALAGERAPGADGSLIPVDIDATIVLAHSEKEKAAPTWKKTYGLFTELPGIAAGQQAERPRPHATSLTGMSCSAGRVGRDRSLRATESGHSVPNGSPSFSSLPLVGTSPG